MPAFQNLLLQVLELLGLRHPNRANSTFPFNNENIMAIEKSRLIQALDAAPKIWENGGVKVARVAEDVVVKYGPEVKIWEANNMRFVAQHTTVRLPTVLDAWVDSRGDEEDICYIVMTYIEGLLLDEVWPGLSDRDSRDIQQQLYGFIQELRGLKADYPGPIGGGVSNGAFFTDYGAGPFTSKEDMEAWFDERLAVCRDFGVVDQKQEGFRGLFQHLVMCHLDLHPRNLILDCRGQVWLIDWAFAGMYPAYFETASIQRYGGEVYFGVLLGQLNCWQYKKETNRLFAISFALTTGAICKPAQTPDSYQPKG